MTGNENTLIFISLITEVSDKWQYYLYDVGMEISFFLSFNDSISVDEWKGNSFDGFKFQEDLSSMKLNRMNFDMPYLIILNADRCK